MERSKRGRAALGDAKEGVAEQDAKILGLTERSRAAHDHRAQTNPDLLTQDGAPAKAEESARQDLSFAPFVPDRARERQDRQGVELFEKIDAVSEAFHGRVSVVSSIALLRAGARDEALPTMAGAPRLYYITPQAESSSLFVIISKLARQCASRISAS